MIPAAPFQEKRREQKLRRSNLSKLTEETIRARTKAGDTPLHRAAKKGQIDLIPSHLLSSELFMVKNNEGNTPLHVAARYGTLNQVPRQFLTKETLTIRATPPFALEGFYFTGSGYKAQIETPLHIAALYGHGDQIPQEFLTPEYLCIEAKGWGETLLHYLARAKSLDVVSQNYAHLIWNLKDRNGQTAHDLLEGVIAQENYVAQVQSESGTEKQKEKLRYVGCIFDDKITKGQASDTLDECARRFPAKDAEYYNRPATEEQLLKVREINAHCEPDELFYDFEEEGSLTYGKAKDLIQDWEMYKREQVERSDLTDCADSYWEKHHWDDNYEESERGQFDQVCFEILDGWEFEKFGDLPTRKQVRKAWNLVRSQKSDKTKMPTFTELVAVLAK